MRFLDYNPLTGVREDVAFEGDKTIIRTSINATKIVENNKASQNEAPPPAWKQNFHKVASIPFTTLMQWGQEDGVNVFTMTKEEQEAYLRRKLNDPDWRHLKTTPRRI